MTQSPFGPTGSVTGMSGEVSGTHVYAAPGGYTVIVTVRDDGGASASGSFVVTAEGGVTPPEQTIFDLQACAKSGLIDIRWTPVAGASSYNVYRSTTPGGPYAAIATGHPCDYCAFEDTGLTDGIICYYVVTSNSAGAESLPSNGASATPTAVRRGR